MLLLYLVGLLSLACGELFPDHNSSGECHSSDPHEHCQHEFVIKLHPDNMHLIELIAKKYGLIYEGIVGSMPEYHVLRHHHSKNHVQKREIRAVLSEDPRIEWSMGQAPKIRVKRDNSNVKPPKRYSPPTLPFSDPFYVDQWYLHGGAAAGSDMGVIGAWNMGYAGRNVSVSILDDGIQPDHPDLKDNYDPMASTDINDKDDDPTPRDNGDNKHGTRCAGEVSAMAGNDYCGVGAAFHSRIGGVRMLDGPVSDRVEAASLSHNPQHIDIYSASWGPEDDGRTFDGPGPLAKDAFYKGITAGRQGKGNIFVWASGNGGAHKDSCSCDGYTTSIYTLSISSATAANTQPWYLEECPSTLATTYSSGSYGQKAIVTTDMPSKCTKQHTGTSASAPLAAGIVALALEANPSLTWRDMQHCVVRSSNPSALLFNGGWSTNGVNRKVSNKFGYGLLNAAKLVQVAKDWKPIPQQKTCTYEYEMESPNPRPLNGKGHSNFSLTVRGCQDTDHEVRYLEHIQAVITIKFSRRGDIKLTLLSPMGTRSVILPARSSDMNSQGFHKWPFLSVQQWGEDPRGQWTLTFENVGAVKNHGTLHDWSLLLYGTSSPAQSTDPTYAETVSPNRYPTPSNPPLSTSEDHQVTISHSSSLTHPNVGDCDEECDESGCTDTQSAIACHSCRHYSMKLQNRAGTKCVSSCPDGWYKDDSSLECRQCLRSCRTCSGPDVCDMCHDTDFLVIADHGHFHHGQCVAECPQDFQMSFGDGKRVCRLVCAEECLTCDFGSNKCKTCKHGMYLDKQGSCVSHCPPTFFDRKEDRTCQRCAPNCAMCTHYSPSSCTRCNEGMVYSNELDMCVHERQSSSNCHSHCTTCTGPAPNQCSVCRNGLPPEKGVCPPCLYSQFYESTERVCSSCDESCSGCTGPKSRGCINCANGYNKVTGVCLPCCKPKQLPFRNSCGSCLGWSGGQEGLSQLAQISILICALVVMVFVVVFAVLTCRSSGKQKTQYEYSKLNLPGITGEQLDVLESDWEDSDPEDDTIFKKSIRP